MLVVLMRERWTVVDRRTGEPVTMAIFPSQRSAEDHITEWQNRHARGGRPDITRELLVNMEPRLLSDAGGES